MLQFYYKMFEFIVIYTYNILKKKDNQETLNYLFEYF